MNRPSARMRATGAVFALLLDDNHKSRYVTVADVVAEVEAAGDDVSRRTVERALDDLLQMDVLETGWSKNNEAVRYRLGDPTAYSAAARMGVSR